MVVGPGHGRAAVGLAVSLSREGVLPVCTTTLLCFPEQIVLQLLKLGPKIESWQEGGKVPHNLCCCPKSGAGLVCREIQTLCCHPSLCTIGVQGALLQPLGPPRLLCRDNARQNRREHLSSPKNNFENESGEAEPETLSLSFLTFQIGNSLSSLPGRTAICISRGQDVAISFYHLKIVIKSLFGNKTMHARKDGLRRLKLTAPVIPDFTGCCWRMLKRGGTGTAGDANGAKP